MLHSRYITPVMYIDPLGFSFVRVLLRESVRTQLWKFGPIKYGVIAYNDLETLYGDTQAIIDFYSMTNLSSDLNSLMFPSTGMRINIGDISLIGSTSLSASSIGVSINSI